MDVLNDFIVNPMTLLGRIVMVLPLKAFSLRQEI
jgi:hypothetical protein